MAVHVKSHRRGRAIVSSYTRDDGKRVSANGRKGQMNAYSRARTLFAKISGQLGYANMKGVSPKRNKSLNRRLQIVSKYF